MAESLKAKKQRMVTEFRNGLKVEWYNTANPFRAIGGALTEQCWMAI